MAPAYLSIAGEAMNWAWSLADLESPVLRPAYHRANEAPAPLRTRKKPGKMLWAFNGENYFNRLREKIASEGIVHCVLINNSFKGLGYRVPRGIFAFGTIRDEDLVGRVSWDYWPIETGWDYKFFIEVGEMAPGVKESLNRLKDLTRDEFVVVSGQEVLTSWAHDIIDIIPSNVIQGSLFDIGERTFSNLKRLASWNWRAISLPQETGRPTLNIFRRVMFSHLLSGKNIIIYGPPGSGKTRLAKELVANICGDNGYSLVTGNPQWTTFNTLGGLRLPSGEFQPGFLLDAVVRCWIRLRDEGKPFWLIIDEINRTNADTAFGEAFTAFDVAHRRDVRLLEGPQLAKAGMEDVLINGDLYVPFSFRVVATMNSYDRTLLFRLGFAFLRRFAIVPLNPHYSLAPATDDFRASAGSFVSELFSKQRIGGGVDLSLIEEQLILANGKARDYALLEKSYYENFMNDGIDGYVKKAEQSLGFSPIDLVEGIRHHINEQLDGTGVVLTEALSADAIKFLIASYLHLQDESLDNFRGLLDEAIAAYLLPQLDVLSDKIRAERMGVETGDIEDRIGKVKDSFRRLGLDNRCVPLLERLSRGERIP